MGQTSTAIAILAGIAPNLFSLYEFFTSAWKDVRDKKFEAAGVIYEANRILKSNSNTHEDFGQKWVDYIVGRRNHCQSIYTRLDEKSNCCNQYDS